MVNLKRMIDLTKKSKKIKRMRIKLKEIKHHKIN